MYTDLLLVEYHGVAIANRGRGTLLHGNGDPIQKFLGEEGREVGSRGWGGGGRRKGGGGGGERGDGGGTGRSESNGSTAVSLLPQILSRKGRWS